MRASARRSQARPYWRTGHSTVHVRCATGHPGGPRRQKLQRSESIGFGDVAGASDMSGVHRTVRCEPDCPVHHTTDSLHQRSCLVVGAINTPTTPPFIASKFLAFKPHTRALDFIQRHKQEIKSSPKSKDHSNQIVTSERVTCVHLSSCAWIASFFLDSFL